MSDALELFTVSRECFGTLYVRSESIQFSRMVLYTGIPAVLVAHDAVGVIDEGALPGSTFGVRDRPWFEAGTLTLAILPALVLGSYVARHVADTSIFIRPFLPAERSLRRSREDGDRRHPPRSSATTARGRPRW